MEEGDADVYPEVLRVKAKASGWDEMGARIDGWMDGAKVRFSSHVLST